MSNSLKFAVLGAGHGGHAMAADLSLASCEVNLFNRSPEPIEAIHERGGIKITGEAVYGEGLAKLNKATTNMKEAIEGVDVIMIVVPAYGHKLMYETCAPYLEDGQIVVTHAGNYGTLEFASILREMKIKEEVMIAETSTLIYSCKRIGPAEVRVDGLKRIVPFAALPSRDTEKCLKVLNQVYPQFVPATNVLETSLSSANMVFHPTTMLLNAGLIERTKGDFLFYIHGMTPSVARVCELVDKERIAVGNALGLELTSVKDALYKKYGSKGKTLYEAIQDTKPYWDYSAETAPSDLKSRYLTEDVPYGLVPLASIGNMIGVPTPSVKTIIDLASLVNQVDYWKEGLTVEKIGIDGLNQNEINKLVTEREL